MAPESFKRKLTAILSADVKGYSRLMGEDEAETVKTLTAYRKIMGELIEQHRGHVVDSPGDNILAEFASVVDAVQCSVAIQNEFKARNAALPENRRMEFRIGVNLGDVIEEEGRLYGDGVNIAARLEGLADPGGICISKTALDHIESKLPLGYEYLGEQTVKNIAKPVGAYRVVLEPRITVAGTEKKKAPFRSPRLALAIAVIAILLAGGLALWQFALKPSPPAVEKADLKRMALALPDKPSIAVLPFVNMSEDPKQEYFSDGLTDEIISALSKVPKLFVIASHSTFSYKGRQVKIQQVAEELGVRYVLEGSVRKSEDRVRITAQLIDALKGHHLWSERYDRTMSDIFALQDDVTKNIIVALQVKMMPGDEVAVYAKGTNNLDAYLKALEAYWFVRQVKKEYVFRAQQLAEEAIALDPNYAYAYHLLASIHRTILWLGLSKSPEESVKKAFQLESKAVTLDDSLAIAHAGLGSSLAHDRQYDKAIEAGEKAVSLEPHSADVLFTHASNLMLAGNNEKAIPLFEEALRLNPKPDNVLYRYFGNALANVGRYEEAIALQKRAIQQNPHDIFAHMVMASVCSMAGRKAEARAAANEVLRLNPNFSVASIRKVRPDRDPVVAKRWCDTLVEAGLPETPPLPLPDKPSIAVLPFVNLSDDKGQEYFSYGLTEEIITALSKTPKLFVIARNSSFVYKGKPVNVQQVSRELGVKYVLEGSVRRSGDQLRVTAQLIDATTRNHLWAERYDREMKDVFAIQDDVTMKILTSLQVKLTAGEEARMWARGTKNLNAYLKLLAATENMFQFNKEHNALAQQLAKEAIELDPQYASAYVILGKTHMMDVLLGTGSSPKQSMAQAFQMTQKAIAIDESLGAARGLLGFLHTMAGQFEKGIAEAEKAVSLEPNSDIVLQYMGLALRWGGRPNEAIPVIKKAIRLNPFAPSNYIYNLGLSYLFAGQNEEAIAECRKAAAAEPHNLGAQLALAVAYGLSGRDEEARATALDVLRIDPKFSLEGFSKTLVYKNQDDKDRFVDALRKAGLK